MERRAETQRAVDGEPRRLSETTGLEVGKPKSIKHTLSVFYLKSLPCSVATCNRHSSCTSTHKVEVKMRDDIPTDTIINAQQKRTSVRRDTSGKENET